MTADGTAAASGSHDKIASRAQLATYSRPSSRVIVSRSACRIPRYTRPSRLIGKVRALTDSSACEVLKWTAMTTR